MLLLKNLVPFKNGIFEQPLLSLILITKHNFPLVQIFNLCRNY